MRQLPEAMVASAYRRRSPWVRRALVVAALCGLAFAGWRVSKRWFGNRQHEEVAPAFLDPVDACARTASCRSSADTIALTDPDTAVTLYTISCKQGDGDACLRGARIALQRSPVGVRTTEPARTLFELACERDTPGACIAGVIAHLGTIGDALRACERGEAEGCALASNHLVSTDFAEAAPVLMGHGPIDSPRFGHIVAVRWGQWTTLDHGEATLWVANPPPSLARERLLVTRFPVDKVPATIPIPPGAKALVAIAFGSEGKICARCEAASPCACALR